MATPKTPQDKKPKATKKTTTKTKQVELKQVIRELSMDEIDFVEGISNVSIDVLEMPGQPKALFIAAVTLVLGRRTQPNLSWSEVRANGLEKNLEIIAENYELPKAPVSALKHPEDESNKPYIV